MAEFPLHVERQWPALPGHVGYEQWVMLLNDKEGDRIEIYRRLRIDPKEARRHRASLKSS